MVATGWGDDDDDDVLDGSSIDSEVRVSGIPV